MNFGFINKIFRLEIQSYTQHLVQDTSMDIEALKSIPNLPPNTEEYKYRKVQKDRLLEIYTDALNQFQKAQCSTLQRRKEIYQKKQSDSNHESRLPPPSSGSHKYTDHLIELQDQSNNQQQTQQMIQEELNLQALERQANSIRELEVLFFRPNVEITKPIILLFKKIRDKIFKNMIVLKCR